MSRRRLIELLVAAGVLLLLLAIVFVRPTARRTGAPASLPLFTRAPGAAPDFSAGSYSSLVAYSPDSSRALVVYPVAVAQRADVYVMDHALAEGYRLVLEDSLHGADSPKTAGWIDRARAWVVVGRMASPGGDLYELDPETGGTKLLWTSPDSGRTQALSFAPPSSVRLSGDSTVTLAP